MANLTEAPLRKGCNPFKEVMRAVGIFRDHAEKTGFLPIRFSNEARVLLVEQGFHLYELSGGSLGMMGLGQDSVEFSLGFGSANRDARKITSHTSEVAIAPDSGTYGARDLSFDGHCEQLDSSTLDSISDVHVGMGNAADYAELALLHFQATGELLYGGRGIIAASLLDMSGMPVYAVVQCEINEGVLRISVHNCAPSKVKDPLIGSVGLVMPIKNK